MSNQMTNCKTCNEAIAKSAKTCTKCGAKNKKPFYKKWWFWVIIVVFVVGAAASQGDYTQNSVQKESAGTGSQARENATSNTTASEDLVFGLNETAVFPNLKITALEVKESSGDGFFIVPGTGNVIIGVKFEIENTSNREEIISSLMLFDMYADGVKVDLALLAAAADEFKEGTLDGSLSSGRKMIGWIPIEVSRNTRQVEFEVKDGWLSNNKAVFKIDI